MYSFFIDSTQYYPNYEKCSIIVKEEGINGVRKRYELQGDLIFYDDEFDYLYNEYYLNEIYEIDITIQKSEIAGDYLVGKLSLQGKYKVAERIAELKVKIIDVYTTLTKNQNKDVNILNAVVQSTVTINTQSETKIYYIYQTWDDIVPEPYIPIFVEDLAFDETQIAWDFDSYETDLINKVRTYTLKRQVAPTEYIGYDYYANVNEWSKASVTTDDLFIALRARTLRSCLNYMLSQIYNTITVPADFCEYLRNFDISTYKYTIMIMQKSDAKRPYDSNPATILNITFETLMKYLNKIFNLDYYIENNKLYLKHVSEKTFTTDANLFTNYKNKNWTTALTEFENQFDLPSQENIYFEQSNNSLFSECKYEYDYENGDVKEEKFSEINNDIKYLMLNLSEVSDTGLVFLIGYEEEGVATYVSHTPYFNGDMISDNLKVNFLNDNRPFTKDTLQSGVTLTKAYNVNAGIIRCPIDNINTIEFNKLYKTDLSSACRITEIKENMNGSLAEIKIKIK